MLGSRDEPWAAARAAWKGVRSDSVRVFVWAGARAETWASEDRRWAWRWDAAWASSMAAALAVALAGVKGACWVATWVRTVDWSAAALAAAMVAA